MAVVPGSWITPVVSGKSSFLEAHVEFQESEVSLMCRKMSLINDQGPGVIYLND